MKLKRSQRGRLVAPLVLLMSMTTFNQVARLSLASYVVLKKKHFNSAFHLPRILLTPSSGGGMQLNFLHTVVTVRT